MAIYFHDPAAKAEGDKEIAGIEDAVKRHDTGALQKMLDEVNQHDSMSLAGPRAVYNQLPKDAQQAITPLDYDNKVRGNSPTHLEVSNVWAAGKDTSKNDNTPQNRH